MNDREMKTKQLTVSSLYLIQNSCSFLFSHPHYGMVVLLLTHYCTSLVKHGDSAADGLTSLGLVQHCYCWSGETARAGEAYVGLAGNLNVFTRIDWLVRDTTLFRNILENILDPRLYLMPIRKNTDRLNNILKE